MRFFFSGTEASYHSCVENVLARNDFMISFATILKSGECERLESCGPNPAQIIPGPGIISEEDEPNG